MTLPTNPGSSLALLAREKLERYRSKGAFGKPAYQNHVQLKAMLRAKHGDLYANYFAKPSFDPDTGELAWIADVPGPARRWSDIPVEQQGLLALQLEVVRSRLLAYIGELRAQAGGKTGTASSHATLLEQAMQAPAAEFLFFVGKQPVVAFWGFEDEQGRSVDPSLQAPRFPDGTSGGTDVATRPGDHGAGGPTVPVPGPVPEDERDKRPWWRRFWWLWLLVPLLLLALLLARGCTPDGRFQIERAIKGPPVEQPRDPQDPSRPLSERPVVPGPPGTFGPGGPGGLTGPGITSGPGGPGSVVPGQGADGTVPVPGTDPNATPGGKPETPPVAPDPNQPNDPNKPVDPNRPNEPSVPPKDPTKPNDPTKLADPTKPNDPDRANEPPAGPQTPGDGVKIPTNPQDARKMDFLEGDWKAGSGLADRETGRPLDLSVKFAKDGKGEITLKRQDGSVCKGPVQGTVAGSKLTVDGAQSIPCSNGGTFAPPRIECTARPDGSAPCVGVNRADGQRYGLGMQRQ